MTNLHCAILKLRRPRLLVRAAQEGARLYKRNRDLKRLLGAPANGADVLPLLLAREQSFEADRKADAPTYSLLRHIEVLIALCAEADRYLATQPCAEGGPDKQRPRRSPPGAQIHADFVSDRCDQRKLSGTEAFFSAT